MDKAKITFYKTMTVFLLPFSFVGFGFVGSYGFIKVYFRFTNAFADIVLVTILSILIGVVSYMIEKENSKKDKCENEYNK